jgi:hypothetical protein
MVVVGADHHDVLLQRRIRAFDKPEDVLRSEGFPPNVNGNRGLHGFLRRPKVGNEVTRHRRRHDYDGDFRIGGTVDNTHGRKSCRRVISEGFGERDDAVAIHVARILKNDDGDRAVRFDTPGQRRIRRELGIIVRAGALEHDCDLSLH